MNPGLATSTYVFVTHILFYKIIYKKNLKIFGLRITIYYMKNILFCFFSISAKHFFLSNTFFYEIILELLKKNNHQPTKILKYSRKKFLLSNYIFDLQLIVSNSCKIFYDSPSQPHFWQDFGIYIFLLFSLLILFVFI